MSALSTPSGLTNGQQFRFIWVTIATTTVTSTNWNVYNTFVQTDATNYTYNGVSITATPIVSTAAVNANTQITAGIALYNVRGQLIKANGNLWDGAALSNAINYTLANASPASFIFTGTDRLGQQFYPLGSGYVLIGDYTRTDSQWIEAGTIGSSANGCLYAVSQTFTVVLPCFSVGTLNWILNKYNNPYILMSKMKRGDKKMYRFIHQNQIWEVTSDHKFLYCDKIYSFEELMLVHPLMQKNGINVTEIPVNDMLCGGNSHIYNIYELNHETPIAELDSCLSILGGNITNNFDEATIKKMVENSKENCYKSVKDFINSDNDSNNIFIVKNDAVDKTTSQ